MEYTEKKWGIAPHDPATIISKSGDTIALCDSPYRDQKNIPAEERFGNAKLILTAVNACIKLNPDNPMAVAESISDLYEVLKRVILIWDNFEHITTGDYIVAQKALAKAEGK